MDEDAGPSLVLGRFSCSRLAQGVQVLDGRCDGRHPQTQVVETGSMFREKISQDAVRRRRLEQFDLDSPELDNVRPDSLIRQVLDRHAAESQLSVCRQGGIDVRDSDADVFEADDWQAHDATQLTGRRV